METIITIPTLQGLRIKHVTALHELRNYDEKNPFRHFCKVVSILSGRSMQYLYTRCDARDVVDAYNTGIKIFDQLNNELAKVHKKPLPNEIDVNSKQYELVNLDRPNVSFVIDSDMSDFEKDPVRLACMCYVPKGTVYGEMNDAEDVLHPISSRWEDFNEHAFFLRKYQRLASVYMVSQKAIRSLNKALSMIGYYQLTSWLRRQTQHGAKSSN